MNVLALLTVPAIAGLFLYRLNFQINMGSEGKTLFNMVTLTSASSLMLQAIGWYR